MKCPILEHARLSYDDILSEDVGECIKEKCAWYTEGEPKCCIPVIAFSLSYIADILDEIVYKMPAK